ncbi:hypothetical protein GCM10010492_66530 [Saccharothrix mutabilis subsp. mutabilis]|uniref:DUF1700 domain-containing protein n=1 Tax=Saccharothrix mutabilis subsp. mutabilis TaxID=66855 RepID=A0ABN0UNL7_9PSEU
MNDSVTRHPLVAAYLDRLARRAAKLGPVRRDELLQEIRAHLDASTSTDPSEAEVEDVLHRLGAPEEIVDAELVDVPSAAKPPWRRAFSSLRPPDLIGLGLLLLGGLLLPPVGYLLGAAMVGLSRRWTPTARLVLAALPAVAVAGVVIVLLARGDWYTPADLFSEPRQTLVGLRRLAADVLPFTALQVLALLAVRLTSSHFDRR